MIDCRTLCRESASPDGSHRPCQVFAAIDVGTNAARLEIVRAVEGGKLERLHVERAPVRPGNGVFTSGYMSQSAVDRLLLALRRFAGVCRRYDARVRAVATSAVREARNGEEVVSRARNEAGLEVEVISGREEARLVCMGVLGDRSASRLLVIDIGGGSTEVVRTVGRRLAALHSVALGAVRLTERFGSRGRISAVRLAAMRSDVARVLREAVPRPRHADKARGTGGTINALVAVCGRGGRISRRDVGRAVEEFAGCSLAERRRRFDPTRADIIVAGAVILEATLLRLRCNSVIAVQSGLREGLLREMSGVR
jgi:exopolyphosphatase/guanosine-5'-triphosphate,3'-diphosphate pyrophosphatase